LELNHDDDNVYNCEMAIEGLAVDTRPELIDPGEELGSDIEILVSNLSLPFGAMLLGSLATYEAYLSSIGADGLELTPVRSNFMRQLLYRGRMLEAQGKFLDGGAGSQNLDYLDRMTGFDRSHDWSDEDETYGRIIKRGHSSFRGDADRSLPARPFPNWRSSIRQLRSAQTVVWSGTFKGIPVVLYPGFEHGQVLYTSEPPDGETARRGVYAPFEERLLQPKAHEWRQWGLDETSSVASVQLAMRAHGFGKVACDLLHIQEENEGICFRDPQRLAQRLAAAGLVNEVHLSLNRLDITGLHSELAKSTRQARRAFAKSPEAALRTFEGELLMNIIRYWKNDSAYAGQKLGIVLEDGPLRASTKPKQRAILEHVRELVKAV
jgi:hypothetical protein